MRPEDDLAVDYLTLDQLIDCRDNGMHDVLGIAFFTTEAKSIDVGEVPFVQVPTAPLGSEHIICEVWRAAGPFRTGMAGIVEYRSNGHIVFGCISLEEAGGAGVGHGQSVLGRATERCYAAMFACLADLGFPHVLRIWNYLPDITLVTGSLERYRQFNQARQSSFQSFNKAIKGKVPAASALGSGPGSPIVVYFVAGTEGGLPVENLRQVSAYDYPPQYGSFSPTFARATVSPTFAPSMLFVSGTSSIVGHQTVHAGDVVGQTRESITNVRTVVEQANRAVGGELFSIDRLKWKVYLRRPEDLVPVADELAALQERTSPIVYLKAGICRPDLLVEVEAVGTGV